MLKIRSLLIIFLVILTHSEIFSEPGLVSISGTIISSSTKSPLPGITVRIIGTDLGAISRADGRFEIRNVPPGVYAIQFTGIGYEKYVEPNVSVTSGKPVTLKIEMVDKIIELKGAEVRASYFQKRIESVASTQTLNSQDIRRAPGVQEDVVRATALLPGVGVTQAGRNDLIVRGGAPYENLFIVDGIEVPNINHFGSQGASGGPLSIINIDFVRSVDFSAGGFSAKYGDKLSSLTNITLRNGSDQRLAGEVNLSATGFGAILEGPIDNNSNFLFSARRSYLDLIFKAAGFGFIPEYWDFQGKINYKINQKNTLSFLTIGALNSVSLNNNDEDNRYGNSRVAIPNQQQYFSGLNWQTLFNNGFANFSIGRTYTNFDTYQNDSLLNPIFMNKSKEGETILKAEFDLQLNPKTQLSFGNQFKFASLLDYNIKIPGFMRLDANSIPQELTIDTSFTAIRNGIYGTITTSIDNFKFTVGSRLDYYNYTSNKFYLSPRISGIYQINPVSGIQLSYGRFYQPPSFVWLVGGQTKTLNALNSDIIILGYQHTPLEDVKVQVELYYKFYNSYPGRIFRPQAILAPSGFDDITTDIPFGLEPLSMEATGYSRGLEIFIQKKLSEIPLYGLLSLTLSQSRFKSLDGIERIAPFDAPVIFNIAAGYRFDQEWELSGKFRISSGLPTTPYMDDKSGRLNYAKYNEGDRLPLFHQLDIRVDKRWDLGSFGLITYIDIQNLYARKNVSQVRWNYRRSDKEFLSSIGILPSIGIIFDF